MFWSEKELDHLSGSFLLAQIDERNLAMENDYSSICSVVPAFAEISTLDEFKWARMCVCSRNFGLIINGLRTAGLPFVLIAISLRVRNVYAYFPVYPVSNGAICGHAEPLPPERNKVAVRRQLPRFHYYQFMSDFRG